MEKSKRLVGLGLLLGIPGIILLFFSYPLATALADSRLPEDGLNDSTTYEMSIKGFANSFLVAGGILFSFSLLLLILAYYKNIDSTKENDKH